MMDNICVALFFIRNELTALYIFTQYLMMMMTTTTTTTTMTVTMMHTCIAQSPHAIVACSVRSVGYKAWKPAANGRY